jgi:acyl-CoA reductase-like NAD-dependent aldehyde dehydrogenase
MSQPAAAVSSEITQLSHYVNGEHITGTSGRFGDIFNPSKGVKISEVPLASKSEVEAAIAVAAKARENSVDRSSHTCVKMHIGCGF